MKKVFKYVMIITFAFVALLLLAGTYLKVALPDIDIPEDIKVSGLHEHVERGRYLAHHVAVCMDCHSIRDWSRFSGPPQKGALPGGGGERFGREAGFPGNFYAANITPYALSNWTDAEIFRAITAGVSKDGRALFPVMPYHNYGQLDKEDIQDIIAYLRSLAPVQSSIPLSDADFPVRFLINTMPEAPALSTRPPYASRRQYGAYLVKMAGCADCHSKRENGVIVPGSEFGGGMAFQQPAGIVRAPNITPDTETGIGSWSRELFVRKFKQYADSTYRPAYFSKNDLNTPMPWTMYSGMQETDLEAIYAYLSSLKPLKNEVNRYERR